MNRTIKKIALVSAVAGNLALSGCASSGSYVEGTNSKTGNPVYIFARSPVPGDCTVIVAKGHPDSTTGQILPRDIISDPATVKAQLADNQAALKAALISNSSTENECKPNDKVKVLVEQDLTDFQRK